METPARVFYRETGDTSEGIEVTPAGLRRLLASHALDPSSHEYRTSSASAWLPMSRLRLPAGASRANQVAFAGVTHSHQADSVLTAQQLSPSQPRVGAVVMRWLGIRTGKDGAILCGLVAILIGGIATLFVLGARDRAKFPSRAAAADNGRRFQAQARDLFFHIDDLETGAAIPAEPRVVLMQHFDDNSDYRWDEKELLKFPNPLGVLYNLLDGVPDSKIARTPDEANVIIHCHVGNLKTAFHYSNGKPAYQRVWQIALINRDTRALIDQCELSGSLPDATVVQGGHPLGRSGSTVGDDPTDEARAWIVASLERLQTR
jgi:hypothetical protein